ncbi:MAG: hypothetical protein FWE61_09285, partial [Micrococcales bacterium]|nr:hypothetical protein [Micrococcales bacterium]
LENQGLRATSHGGHIAVFDAVLAQLEPPLGANLGPFQRLRRRRNAQEYPDFAEPPLTVTDLVEDRAVATRLVDLAERVLDQMPVY